MLWYGPLTTPLWWESLLFPLSVMVMWDTGVGAEQGVERPFILCFSWLMRKQDPVSSSWMLTSSLSPRLLCSWDSAAELPRLCKSLQSHQCQNLTSRGSGQALTFKVSVWTEGCLAWMLFQRPESAFSVYFLVMSDHLHQPVDQVVKSLVEMGRLGYKLKIQKRPYNSAVLSRIGWVFFFSFLFLWCGLEEEQTCVAKPH